MTTYNYMLMRGEVSDHAVPGTLTLNGHYVCDTLEPATCCLVKAGTYQLTIVPSCDNNKNKWIRIDSDWWNSGEDWADQQQEHCQRCTEREHERQLCHRRFYNQLSAACADPNLTPEQLEQIESDLHQKRLAELRALPIACPQLTHGSGVVGLAGGTILVGTLPPAVYLGDKRIQLPILKNSHPTYKTLLKRIETELTRGDKVNLIIRG